MDSCFIEKNTVFNNFFMPAPHAHPNYELYILCQGTRNIYIENDKYSLEKNDLLLIPANMPHRTEGQSYTRYLVNFTDEYLDDVQKEIINFCQQHKVTMTAEEAKTIVGLAETMFNIQNDKTKKSERHKDYNFKTCFSYFLFELSRLKNFPTDKYVQANASYSTRTKKIIQYIEKHYAEKITLDSLCEIFYVSKASLCHNFKNNTNMSIIDYLLKKRIERAQYLLINHNKKVGEIAYECGFSSQNYFNLIFTKHVKASPTEYRKSHKQSFYTDN